MDRREFMKRAELAGTGAILAGNQTTSKNANAQTTGGKLKGINNILFLFVDQQRQDCIGCYGNDVVQTPNIDRLARTGIRFNNAYTPGPVCSPARMSVQSGLWPHNHRITFNTGIKEVPSRNNSGAQNPLPETKFFSHTLKKDGWNLAHVGKWHIGTEKHKPTTHGYDDLPFYPGYGYPSKHPHYVDYLKKQGVDGFNLLRERRDPTGFRVYAGLQEGPQSASIPAYLANQTADVVTRYTRDSKPFFISCNFWGPHAPYNITKEHLEKYRNTKISLWPNWDCDLSDKPGVIIRYGEYWKTGWFNEKDLAEMIGEYYGYITLIDEEIGRILKALEDTGELEKTLIVYSADHGSAVGSYRYWDKGFGMYDCITRIPMVISNPLIKPGVSEAFVTLNDLAPTFLEIAGSEVHEMDGDSLIPILNSTRKAIREDHIVTEHHGHQQTFWQRMVRTHSTKYIYNPTSRDEFYDLEADPWETKNIINRIDSNTLKHHREILMNWINETGDPLRVWATPML
ncbi:sulfatase-like hydrolase/transferase [Candidatus Latescibacterota bacterium]